MNIEIIMLRLFNSYNDYNPRLIKYISIQYEINYKLKSFLQFDDNVSNTKNR